ncbi:hypothetical protein T01_8705 [Trichinella spiralis]|uniref:Uncharacterized protein n=1 Tax=Trichinella spiralis TaxID=6334 RepID=A0A0V1BSR4_TRISP|nr:hypothetical protein T01_8705 [Trichinella spiralis]
MRILSMVLRIFPSVVGTRYANFVAISRSLLSWTLDAYWAQKVGNLSTDQVNCGSLSSGSFPFPGDSAVAAAVGPALILPRLHHSHVRPTPPEVQLIIGCGMLLRSCFCPSPNFSHGLVRRHHQRRNYSALKERIISRHGRKRAATARKPGDRSVEVCGVILDHQKGYGGWLA